MDIEKPEHPASTVLMAANATAVPSLTRKLTPSRPSVERRPDDGFGKDRQSGAGRLGRVAAPLPHPDEVEPTLSSLKKVKQL
jgi:hypothetical protein